jgi:hypothetical protein
MCSFNFVFWWEIQEKRVHYEELDVGGRIITEIGWYGLD